MADTFHYPPEIFNLLGDVIPLLCKGKNDVFVFFQGAGVEKKHMREEQEKFGRDKNSVNKYMIARNILMRLSEGGDPDLPARREIIKRIVEFEDYSGCWPDDVLKAKGLVAELRRVVEVKDSFARMKQERDQERSKLVRESERRAKEAAEKRNKIETIKRELFSLFAMEDPQKKGKALEPVLNSLFAANDISVREGFVLRSASGRAIEQIDGVIEVDGNLYLVEMKWYADSIGPGVVSQHLVRVFNRGQSRGLLISGSPFTDAALEVVRDSLKTAPFILVTLEEIVHVLEKELSLKEIIRTKIQAAMLDRTPFYDTLAR